MADEQTQTVPILEQSTGVVYDAPINIASDYVGKPGYSIASPDQIKTADLQQKYSAKPISAFLFNTANTALLSAPSMLARLTGNREAVESLNKYNPWASNLGTAAGLVAPWALEEAGLTGLAKALPVTKILEYGEKAGEATKAALASTSIARSPLLTNVLSKAADYAVSSAPFGASQAVTEHMLGDPELNVSKMIADMGMDTILSGATGGAFGGAFGAAQTLVPRGIRGILNIGKSGAEKMHAALDKDVAQAAGELVSKGYPEESSILQKMAQQGEDAAKIRDVAISTPTRIAEKVDSVANAIGSVQNSFKGLGKHLPEAKWTELEGMFQNQPIENAYSGAVNFVQKANDALNQMSNDENKGIVNQSFIKGARDWVDNFTSKLTDPKKDWTPLQLFKEMDDLKNNLYEQYIGRYDLQFMSKRNPMPPENAAGYSTVKTLFKELQKNLEDPDMWGPAAVRQQQYNEAYSNMMRGWYNKQSGLLTTDGIGTAQGKISKPKLKKFLERIYTDPDNPEVENLASRFQNAMDTMDQYHQQATIRAQNAKIGDVGISKVIDSLKNLEGIKEEMGKDLGTVKNFKQIKELGKIPRDLSAVEMAAKGYASPLSFVPGFSKAGKIIDYLVHDSGELTPEAMIRQRYQIEKSLQGFDKRMDEYVKSFFDNKIVKHIPGKEAALSTALGLSKLIEEKDTKEDPDFLHQTESITKLANDPSAMPSLLIPATEKLSKIAPNHNSMLSLKANEVMQYLNGVMPKKKTGLLDDSLSGSQSLPSDLERADFKRIYKVAIKPENALVHFVNGTANASEMKVLKDVYPSLYRDFGMRLINEASNRKGKVTYHQKQYLSKMLDIPVHSSFDPSLGRMIQGVHNSRTQIPGSRMGTGYGNTGQRQRSMKPMNNLSTAFKSDSQRVLTRQ